MSRLEGHIGLREGIMLIYAILTARLFAHYPSFLIDAGGPAAWQVGLMMTGAGMLFFLPASMLARRFPGQGLAEIGETAAGPVLGPLLTLGVTTWLFGVVAIEVRQYAEAFIISILPTTPPSVLIIVMVLCMVYGSYRGMESLARATVVLFVLIVAGAAVVLIFSLPRSDFSRLYPFWGHGFDQTLRWGLFYGNSAAEMAALLALGYGFRSGRTFRNAGLIAFFLFGLTASAVVLVLVTIFGAPDAAQQPFPMYNLARLVYLGRFLQRTEALIVMFWIFAGLVRLTALFHAGVTSLTGLLRLPEYRPVIFPMALLVTAFSLVPEDYLVVLRTGRDIIHPLGLTVLAIPLVLLLLSLVRKKGGQTHAA